MFAVVHPAIPWDAVPLVLAVVLMYAISYDELALNRAKAACESLSPIDRDTDG